jgi:ribosomal protein L37AE/L43A
VLIDDSYIECHSGWNDLINDLSDKLEALIVSGNWEEGFVPYVCQIKEKHGTLRFYMSTETEEMSKLIAEAEEKSKHTCEMCGKEGKLREANKWYMTRCDECWETRYDRID